jgi:hypothetical protein
VENKNIFQGIMSSSKSLYDDKLEELKKKHIEGYEEETVLFGGKLPSTPPDFFIKAIEWLEKNSK